MAEVNSNGQTVGSMKEISRTMNVTEKVCIDGVMARSIKDSGKKESSMGLVYILILEECLGRVNG